ncbi:anti-sigma-K factor RskA [Microbacterium sp. SLBN-154]|uniref:anti-sigma factor n=1 Tax=Microbacterium sp. SLBN-154 TaxID=2768458 RepID=UPI00115078A6|nr:anti-sigma factor [Microbacterium sp. SLBN-154]TQK20244.1 anti-sigma-K factor RskA [Microbacterium sp. SLBN-154]
MNEQEFAELAAGFALDALSPDDAQAFEQARIAHPEWAHHVEDALESAALLADVVPAVSPPASVRDTLMAQITGDAAIETEISSATGLLAAVQDTSASPSADAAPPAGPRTDDQDAHPTTTGAIAVVRRRWTRGLLALAASFVLLVALGFGAASVNEYLNRTPAQVALAAIEAAPDAASVTAEAADGGVVTARWSPSLEQAVVVTDGLPQLTDDQVFELWVLRGDEVTSAGTFEPAPGGEAVALLEASFEQGDTIAMSVEPAGGSPTGLPTSDPLVAITTDA